MFSGRRNINLGNKKPASATSVLRNAEKLRNEREAQRRRVFLVKFVQQKFRSKELIRQARQQLFYELVFKELSPTPERLSAALPYLAHATDSELAEFERKFSGVQLELNPSFFYKALYLWQSNRRFQPALVNLLNQPPPPLVAKLMSSASKDSVNHIVSHFYWGFSTLLVCESGIIDCVTDNSLQHMNEFKGLTFNVFANQKTLTKLILRVAPQMDQWWPLVIRLFDQLAVQLEIPQDLFSNMFNPQVISGILAIPEERLKSEGLGIYCTTLMFIFPSKKTEILVALSLTPDFNIIQYWQTTALLPLKLSGNSMMLAFDLCSYYLSIATESELASNSIVGVDSQVLKDIIQHALLMWNMAFELCSNFTENRDSRLVCLGGPYKCALKLIKQAHKIPELRPNSSLIPNSIFKAFSYTQNNLARFCDLTPQHDSDSDMEDDNPHSELNNYCGSKIRECVECPTICPVKTSTPIDKSTYMNLTHHASLEILKHAPFMIDFETRVKFFYDCINLDKQERVRDLFRQQEVVINRESLFSDTELAFRNLGSGIKNGMRVVLASNGEHERGIDGGGVTRELLTNLCEEIFTGKFTVQSHPLFIELSNHTVIPNPVFYEDVNLKSPAVRAHFHFVGLIIGKCLYETLLIGAEFSSVFLSRLNKSTNLIDFKDLRNLDPEIYNSIRNVRDLPPSQVLSLGLDFSITGSLGQQIDLIPNGFQIAVTGQNRFEYITELCKYKLSTCFRSQTLWILEGLHQVIPPNWLNLFDASELNKLINGVNHDYDANELKAYTEYNIYTPESQDIQWLWEVVQEFTTEERQLFLKFTTSVPKPPLLGFKHLTPHFAVHHMGYNPHLLPTSSTCMNLLRLPHYPSKEILKQKLLYAIKSNSGFDLE